MPPPPPPMVPDFDIVPPFSEDLRRCSPQSISHHPSGIKLDRSRSQGRVGHPADTDAPTSPAGGRQQVTQVVAGYPTDGARAILCGWRWMPTGVIRSRSRRATASCRDPGYGSHVALAVAAGPGQCGCAVGVAGSGPAYRAAMPSLSDASLKEEKNRAWSQNSAPLHGQGRVGSPMTASSSASPQPRAPGAVGQEDLCIGRPAWSGYAQRQDDPACPGGLLQTRGEFPSGQVQGA